MTDAMLSLFDGKLAELEICEPTWLYAGRLTNLDDGTTWRFIYRSTVIRTGDPLHNRVLDYLDGTSPVGNAEIVTDPQMMWGTGELTLWQ